MVTQTMDWGEPMARWKRTLMAAAGTGLLCGCTGTGIAQNAHVVTAGTLTDDVAARDDYRWIDRARALWDTVGDAPPDYSFSFAGGQPMAWETRDGYWVVVEDRAEGTRTYFFAPGERGPFLVREVDRSFGYQDGHVAAVYDAGGGLLPRYEGARWLGQGEDLYQRGRRLRDALLDRQWAPVDTTRWTELNLFFIGIDPGWDSGWRYRGDSFAFADQRRWAEERARRAAMAAAFARWRNGNFQGPPPPGLGHHWEHRPPRPGQPPHGGRPPQPPGAGQPVPPPPPPGGRPPSRPWMWGGLPGAGGGRPDRPQGGPRPAPPPGSAPVPPPQPGAGGPGQPPADATPGWHGWRPGGPGGPRPDGGAGRPPRPDGNGPGRPGWQGGRPPSPPPAAAAPPAPGAPPPAAAPAPRPAAPAGDAGPRRGGWMTPNWGRPARPDGTGGEAPRPSFRPPAAHVEGAPAPSRPSPPPAAPPPPRAEPAARPAPPPRAEPRPASPVARVRREAGHE